MPALRSALLAKRLLERPLPMRGLGLQHGLDELAPFRSHEEVRTVLQLLEQPAARAHQVSTAEFEAKLAHRLQTTRTHKRPRVVSDMHWMGRVARSLDRNDDGRVGLSDLWHALQQWSDRQATRALAQIGLGSIQSPETEQAVVEEHKHRELLQAIGNLAARARFEPLGANALLGPVHLIGGDVIPPPLGPQLQVFVRGRKACPRRAAHEADLDRVRGLKRWLKVRVGAKSLSVAEDGGMVTLPARWARLAVDQRLRAVALRRKQWLAKKLDRWGLRWLFPQLTCYADQDIESLMLPDPAERAAQEREERDRKDLYEHVLVVASRPKRKTHSDGTTVQWELSDARMYDDVPCHLLPMLLPGWKLRLTASESFFIVGALMAGSVMPIYRSLNFVLEHAWVAKAVLGSLAATIAYAAYSARSHTRACLQLQVCETVLNLDGASGAAVPAILGLKASEARTNEMLLAYACLLCCRQTGAPGLTSSAVKRPILEWLQAEFPDAAYAGDVAFDVKEALRRLTAIGLVTQEHQHCTDGITRYRYLAVPPEEARCGFALDPTKR